MGYNSSIIRDHPQRIWVYWIPNAKLLLLMTESHVPTNPMHKPYLFPKVLATLRERSLAVKFQDHNYIWLNARLLPLFFFLAMKSDTHCLLGLTIAEDLCSEKFCHVSPFNCYQYILGKHYAHKAIGIPGNLVSLLIS